MHRHGRRLGACRRPLACIISTGRARRHKSGHNLTMTPKIKVLLDPGAAMPTRAHDTDAGYDVTALRTWLIQGNGTAHELKTIADCVAMKDKGVDCAKIKIDTGVHV